MREKKIKILICDDSAFMRSALKGMIQTDPSIEVVATARDGEEAIKKVALFKPDLVTMDVEMPRVDGLTAIKHIMKNMPVPILVVSSLTEEGAQVTLEAMEAGAVDFISKELGFRSLNIMNIQEDLIARIKAIAIKKLKLKPRKSRPVSDRKPVSWVKSPQMAGNVLAIALGVSTGGPKALQDVIPYFPDGFSVPIIIVQHMPVAFTKSFAERLNSISPLDREGGRRGRGGQARDGHHCQGRQAFKACSDQVGN